MTNSKLFEIADKLSKLTALEAKELINILENEYSIKPAEAAASNKEEKVVEIIAEKTEFDVYLEKVEPYQQKMQIIKVIKEVLGLGLKESKELIDSSPCIIKRGVLKAEAELIKSRLAEFDAKVQLK